MLTRPCPFPAAGDSSLWPPSNRNLLAGDEAAIANPAPKCRRTPMACRPWALFCVLLFHGFDAATSQTFSTVATTGAAATGVGKYRGAGVVGTKVRASLSCCHPLLCVSIAMLAPPPPPLASTL